MPRSLRIRAGSVSSPLVVTFTISTIGSQQGILTISTLARWHVAAGVVSCRDFHTGVPANQQKSVRGPAFDGFMTSAVLGLPSLGRSPCDRNGRLDCHLEAPRRAAGIRIRRGGVILSRARPALEGVPAALLCPARFERRRGRTVQREGRSRNPEGASH